MAERGHDVAASEHEETIAPSAPRRGGRRIRNLALGFAASVLVIVAALFIHDVVSRPYPWLNHDVSLLTYLGFDILEGSRLYVDTYELNPPGAHFLQAAILGISRVFSMSEILTHHLFVLLLGVAGMAVLQAAFPRAEDDAAFALVLLAYLLVIVRGHFANNVLPAAPGLPYDFGQREHLFSILFVPYLLWSVVGRRASRAILPYLALLGYVAMFKPYWPVLVVGVEAYVVIRHGRRSSAAYGAVATGLLAPFVILALHSYRSFVVFFGEQVPMVLGGSYSPYDMAFGEFALSPLHVQMASAGVLFVLCWWGCMRLRLLDRFSLGLLLAVALTTYLSVIHQHKFWSYHGMVYFAVVAVAGVFQLTVLVDGALEESWRWPARAAVAVALLSVVGTSVHGVARLLEERTPKGSELVPVLRNEGSVMFFSTAADYVYAPLYLKKPTVGPWREHFALPALLAIEDPGRRRDALRAYGRRVKARIDEARPDLLLFAPYRHALPPGVTIHDVLEANGAIPKADYVRLPGEWLAAGDPRLRGWVAYRRVEGR